jgi:membrane-associated phospholipid phosphatase
MTSVNECASDTGSLPALVRPRRPVAASAAVVALCYLALTAVMIGAGLVITHLLSHSVGRWDEQVNAWFARHRTPGANRVTGDFTVLADTIAVAAVAALVVIVVLIRHHARLAWLLVIGLTLELAVFLSTNYAVARPRPHVPHLGSTPSTFSWPSGHVAATFVLYGGIALIVTLVTSRLWPRLLAWSAAVALTACVGLSRIYRGDHHPTDTMAGLVLGIAALASAFLAVRVWASLTASRSAGSRSASTPAADVPSEGVRAA